MTHLQQYEVGGVECQKGLKENDRSSACMHFLYLKFSPQQYFWNIYNHPTLVRCPMRKDQQPAASWFYREKDGRAVIGGHRLQQGRLPSGVTVC
mmetsp:Transcript_12183/g.28190  ORF Transcript_12183/g.28190 Transcript_12183/m.28190 type:complete len:94 (+) Transcript_12183:220-501(+)